MDLNLKNPLFLEAPVNCFHTAADCQWLKSPAGRLQIEEPPVEHRGQGDTLADQVSTTFSYGVGTRSCAIPRQMHTCNLAVCEMA